MSQVLLSSRDLQVPFWKHESGPGQGGREVTVGSDAGLRQEQAHHLIRILDTCNWISGAGKARL